MHPLHLLHALAVQAKWRPATILAPFVLCCLLIPASVISAASLSGRFDYRPWGVTVDLSEEGTLDWGHWGLVGSEWSYNHKYGVAQQITHSFITVTGYPGWPGPYFIPIYGADPRYGGTTPFSWTDGMPFRLVEYTDDGVSVYGDKTYLGNIAPGFHIECPADTRPRTLRIYVGNSWGPSTFTASLGGATYTDDSLDGLKGGDGAAVSGVYTLNFQADSPGQTLIVEFTSIDSWWYTTLQAATLTGPNSPPTAAILAPADGARFSPPAAISLTAAATDSDGAVTNLTLLEGTTVVGQSTSGTLSITLSNRPVGVYNFLAVAKDNGGLSITSFPVRVYVTANGGTLTGRAGTPPYYVDLTAEGPTDWAHWGQGFPAAFNHKSGVTERIPNVVLLNASTSDLTNYTDNPTAYYWSDGTPTLADYGTTGIFLSLSNNPLAGFQLTVPADNHLRRLKVYVGLLFAQGKLDARLSDFSAMPYSDSSLFQADDTGYAVYDLMFASANLGANLIVTWTPAAVFNPFYADLRWQAATLSEPSSPPVLRVIYPPPAPNEFAFSFYAQTGSNYIVLFADDLVSGNWQTLSNFAGTGTDALVVDRRPIPLKRFYRVLMQ